MQLYKLEDIIETFGSKAELARQLNYQRSAITKWGGDIPDSKQVMVMRLMESSPKWVKLKYNVVRAARLQRDAE